MKKSSNNIYSCTGLSKVFSFTLSQTFKNRAYRVSYIMFIVLMMVMGPINQLGMSAGMGAAHSTDAINDEMDLKQIYFVNDTYLDFSAEKAELDGTGFAAAKLTDAEAVPDKLAADEIAVLLDRQMIDEVDTYVLNIIAAALPVAMLQLVIYPKVAVAAGGEEYGLMLTVYSIWIMTGN